MRLQARVPKRPTPHSSSVHRVVTWHETAWRLPITFSRPPATTTTDWQPSTAAKQRHPLANYGLHATQLRALTNFCQQFHSLLPHRPTIKTPFNMSDRVSPLRLQCVDVTYINLSTTATSAITTTGAAVTAAAGPRGQHLFRSTIYPDALISWNIRELGGSRDEWSLHSPDVLICYARSLRLVKQSATSSRRQRSWSPGRPKRRGKRPGKRRKETRRRNGTTEYISSIQPSLH